MENEIKKLTNEHMQPHYEKLVRYALQRLDPTEYGYEARNSYGNIKKNPKPFQLTDGNRKLLKRYYRHMVNEGLALSRTALVIGVLGRLLEMLGKDFETATKEDIMGSDNSKGLVTQINEMQIKAVTKSDYLKKLKMLDKFLSPEGEASERTKKIKTGVGKKHFKLPSQLITPEEAIKLVNSCDSTRDRALIHVLWESGGRVGEIINLKMNSVEFNKGEAHLRMFGKTGERQILLLESVRDLQEYMRTRINTKPEDALFVLEGNKGKGDPLNHTCINGILERVKERAKLSKHVNAYLFRHSRASHLASEGLNEAQLCMIFGWAIGSKQPATYIHLSGKQTESAYKKLYGIERPEEKQEKLIKCQTCGEINSALNDTCTNCFNPLNIQGALKLKKQNEYLQEASEVLQQIHSKAFELMRQGVQIDKAEEQAKLLVAEAFANKLQQEQKLKVLA